MKYLDMRTVLARFEGTDRDYSYFVPAGDKPQVGDFLVTSCSWDNELGDDDEDAPGLGRQRAYKALSSARIAKVVKVETTPNPKAVRFYLKSISVSEIEQQGKANREMAVNVAKRAEAKRRLDVMLSEQDRIEQYRRLAAANPEAAALLAELE